MPCDELLPIANDSVLAPEEALSDGARTKSTESKDPSIETPSDRTIQDRQ